MNSFFKTRKLEKNTQTVENSDSILVLLFISIFIYLYTYVSPTILIHPKLDLRTTRFKDLLDLRTKTQLPSYFTKYQHSI